MLRAAIQRPIAVTMLFAALVLIGVLSYQRLPVDLLPSITYPRLTVITTYEDIPAEDLERLVTQPLEEVITALTGVRGVVSRTREGVSRHHRRVRVGHADGLRQPAPARGRRPRGLPRRLPRGGRAPGDPALGSDLAARSASWCSRARAASRTLTEFAREVVKPALEQVDGISQAEVVGGADREILVQPDPAQAGDLRHRDRGHPRAPWPAATSPSPAARSARARCT